jgi:ubiquinone/menaquinone biosynthesis C-methylase UbiE
MSGPPRGRHASTYFSSPASGAETSRLLYQDRLLTSLMGGLLSEQPEEIRASLHEVADLACGPGGWALDLAFTHPKARVSAVDISETMIRYAQTQAAELGLANTEFRVMDVTRPLDFPDSDFDLVNARYIFSFMPARRWPGFLAECLRVLRPGGILRLTECEVAVTNSPAYQRIFSIGLQAMVQHGLTFSIDGQHMGVLSALGRLMKDAGLEQLQRKPYLVDFSIGEEVHDAWYRDLSQLWQLGKPFAVASSLITGPEYDQLCHQAMSEMQMANFRGIWWLATYFGTKPRREPVA